MNMEFLIELDKKLIELSNMLEQANFSGQKSIWAAYNAFSLISAMRTDITKAAEIEQLNSETPSKSEKNKE